MSDTEKRALEFCVWLFAHGFTIGFWIVASAATIFGLSGILGLILGRVLRANEKHFLGKIGCSLALCAVLGSGCASDRQAAIPPRDVPIVVFDYPGPATNGPDCSGFQFPK